ncbi:MAG: hypothetical protein PVI80_12610, partial [Anaerolineae bacterium]
MSQGEHKPGKAFTGVVGRTYDQFWLAWPNRPGPRASPITPEYKQPFEFTGDLIRDTEAEMR